VDADGIYRKTGPARIFRAEKDVIAAIKSGSIKAGDVVVLMCRGPMGSGMEEIFAITSALRYLDYGKHVAVITDARFSGVSTGACIGHITPEALAGGPLSKVREGDRIAITIDRVKLEGSVDLVVDGSAEAGARELAARTMPTDLAPDPDLPPETRLWAALQDASGGTWAGCVFDVDKILERLKS
jgi:dihydroxyacid dehydratase/phosphogluconate dehydratase